MSPTSSIVTTTMSEKASPSIPSSSSLAGTTASKDRRKVRRAPTSVTNFGRRERPSKRSRPDGVAAADGDGIAGGEGGGGGGGDGFLQRLHQLRNSLPRNVVGGRRAPGKSSSPPAAAPPAGGKNDEGDGGGATEKSDKPLTPDLPVEIDCDGRDGNDGGRYDVDERYELEARLRSDVSSARGALDASLLSHGAVLSAKRRELEDAQREIDDLKSRLASASKKLEASSRDGDDARKRLGAGTELRKALEGAVAFAGDRCTKIEREGEAALAEVRSELERVAEQKSNLASAVAGVETRLAQSERKLRDAEFGAERARGEFDAQQGMLKDTVQSQERTLEGLKGRITKMEDTNKAMETKVNAAESASVQLRKANDDLRSELSEVESSLATKVAEADALRADLAEQSSARASNAAEAERRIREAESKMEESAKDGAALRSDLAEALDAAALADAAREKAEGTSAASEARIVEARGESDAAAEIARKEFFAVASELASKSEECARLLGAVAEAEAKAKMGSEASNIAKAEMEAELEEARSTAAASLGEVKAKAASEARKTTIKIRMLEKETSKREDVEEQLVVVQKALDEKNGLLASRQKIIDLLKRQLALIKKEKEAEKPKFDDAKETAATMVAMGGEKADSAAGEAKK